jgi:hypothetical protein
MKTKLSAVLLSYAALAGLSGFSFAAAEEKNSVKFQIFEAPYFVNNNFEPDAADSFAVVTSLEEFNAIFGVGFTMGGPKPAVEAKLFDSQMIVVAVKRGPLVDFNVNVVTRDMTTLTIRYTSEAHGADNATYASPLIVAVSKKGVDEVKFVENDKPVKSIKVAK